MLSYLEEIDRALFLALNGIHNDYGDFIMYWFSEEITWVPFYAILLFGLYKSYGLKNLVPIIIAVAVCITLTDQLSVKAFKEVFERYRPCHNTEIGQLVHLVKNHCGGQYGFVSSHSANTFGLAAFLSVLFGHRKIGIGLMLWAGVVSYSRIYLGVHYPTDIIGGGILGLGIGVLIGFIVRNWIFKKAKSMA